MEEPEVIWPPDELDDHPRHAGPDGPDEQPPAEDRHANGAGGNGAPAWSSPWAEPPAPAGRGRPPDNPPDPPRSAPRTDPRSWELLDDETWDEGGPGPHPGVTTVPPSEEAPGVYRMPATPPPDPAPPDPASPAPDPWAAGSFVPTAEEFARRRAGRPADPVARMGPRAAVHRMTFGVVRPGPGRREREYRHEIDMVRRNFGGLRQVTVVNPKGGAGKTVAVVMLAMTFGQRRGGYVLAWDNNETQGTLGMRAQQDFHTRTVRDLLRDLDHFTGPGGRVGDLSQYVRAQGEGMFDVLASDESATAGEMLTAAAFADIREVVSRFYKLIMVDTGNNVRAANWQAAIDATDQLVITMSARNDSAETAARLLDHLEQSGRRRLVRQAVTVVSMPPSRRELDVPAIQRHFAARTRTVLLAPYERLIDTGEPIRYGALSQASRRAWLTIAAAVAEGL
jgi:MinD-like ATPase involved in chromosome partitioning or flagellar assembly